jgi:hypothetical protein
MPGSRTAAQLVRIVRELTQEVSTNTYRDGFSGDSSTTSTLISILSFVNQSLGILCRRTQIAQQNYPITCVAGQIEVNLPTDAGVLVDVAWYRSGQLKSLTEAALQDLSGRDPNWRYTQGFPCVFVPLGQQLWQAPPPNRTLSGVLRASYPVPDLVLSGDVPSGIATPYHDAIAQFAAILKAASDRQGDLVNYLVSLFEMDYPDLAQKVRVRSFLGQLSRIEGGQDGRAESGGLNASGS